MTNREAYLQELNELAATVVMGWRKTADETIYDDAMWFESDGYLEDMPRVVDWQPCQNETQAWMLVDKVLAEWEQDKQRVYRFILEHRWVWVAWFSRDRYIMERESDAKMRSVAITRAAILASGGELPEHVEG